MENALLLERRKEISSKFLSGKWGTELAGYEEATEADRKKARTHAGAWRD